MEDSRDPAFAKEGGNMHPVLRYVQIAVACAALVVGIGAGVASADDNAQPMDFTHNVLDAPAPVTLVVFG